MQNNIHRLFDKHLNVSTFISILPYLITEHVNLIFNDAFKYCIQFPEGFLVYKSFFFCIFYMQYMKLNCSMFELFEYFRSKSQV